MQLWPRWRDTEEPHHAVFKACLNDLDRVELRVFVALLASFNVLFVCTALSACRVRSALFVHSFRGVRCLAVALLTSLDVLLVRATLRSSRV